MSNEDVTLSTIETEVRRLDPALNQHEDSFKTAVIMLSALKVGTDLNELVRFTGLPESFIAERLERLKAGGVFKGDDICANWFDEENGGIAFWMDVAVAEGLIERVDEGGEAAYVQPDEWPDVIADK